MPQRAALGAVVLAGASILLVAETAAATVPRPNDAAEVEHGARPKGPAGPSHRHGGPENRPPTAVEDPVVVEPGSSVRIRPMANDEDPDEDDLLTLTDVTPSVLEGVTVELQGTTIRVRTPADASTGTRRFSYTVSDGQGATATGVLAVTVERTAGGPTPTTTPRSTTTRPGSAPTPPATTTTGPRTGTTTRGLDPTASPTTEPAPQPSTTSEDRADPGSGAEPVDTTMTGDAPNEGGFQTSVPEPDDGGSRSGFVGGVAVLAVTFGVAALVAYRRFARS